MKGKQMKLNYTLFGIKTTHEIEGYTVHWWSGQALEVFENSYTTPFYAWAVFTGWRMARRWAKFEGRTNHYAVFEGSEARSERLKLWRTIEVVKVVSLFSK